MSPEGKKKSSSNYSGFILNPNKIEFGSLKEGFTYHIPFFLINAGLDTKRFRIKQSTNKNVRIICSHGPVAPGISIKMEAEVVAAQMGFIQEEILVRCDSEELILTITATVVGYDSKPEPNPKAKIYTGKRPTVITEQTNGG